MKSWKQWRVRNQIDDKFQHYLSLNSAYTRILKNNRKQNDYEKNNTEINNKITKTESESTFLSFNKRLKATLAYTSPGDLHPMTAKDRAPLHAYEPLERE